MAHIGHYPGTRCFDNLPNKCATEKNALIATYKKLAYVVNRALNHSFIARSKHLAKMEIEQTISYTFVSSIVSETLSEGKDEQVSYVRHFKAFKYLNKIMNNSSQKTYLHTYFSVGLVITPVAPITFREDALGLFARFSAALFVECRRPNDRKCSDGSKSKSWNKISFISYNRTVHKRHEIYK